MHLDALTEFVAASVLWLTRTDALVQPLQRTRKNRCWPVALDHSQQQARPGQQKRPRANSAEVVVDGTLKVEPLTFKNSYMTSKVK